MAYKMTTDNTHRQNKVNGRPAKARPKVKTYATKPKNIRKIAKYNTSVENKVYYIGTSD
jgi:hypothetical protein